VVRVTRLTVSIVHTFRVQSLTVHAAHIDQSAATQWTPRSSVGDFPSRHPVQVGHLIPVYARLMSEPPARLSMMPVHVSLATADGRLALHDDQERISQWLTEDRELVLAALTDPDAITVEADGDSSVRLHVAFGDVEDHWLHLPLARQSGDELRSARVEPSTEENQDWEDWYQVEPWITALTHAAHRDGQDVVLAVPGRSESVRICFRPRAGAGPSVFVSATFEPDHDVWQMATAQGGEQVLQAPLNDEMVAAASRLALIALRGAGFGPLDVFPARLKRP
jgi:hypothetical protein